MAEVVKNLINERINSFNNEKTIYVDFINDIRINKAFYILYFKLKPGVKFSDVI